MRKTALLFVLLSACKLLKSSGDDVADASAPVAASAAPTASAAPSAAAPTYANEADVKRYPDETPPDAKVGKVTHDGMRVRADVPSGAVVGTLKKGQEVQELGEHGGFILVAFPDPKGGSANLIGWTAKGAFSATESTADSVDHVSSCTGGATDYVGAPYNTCIKQCFQETDCTKPCLADSVQSCSDCDPGQKCLPEQHTMEDGLGWTKGCIGRGKSCPDQSAPGGGVAAGGGGCPSGMVKGTGPGGMPNNPTCFRACSNDGDCDKDMDMERVCKGGRCVAAPN